MLDEGFERLCLICSSLPSIIGPTSLHPTTLGHLPTGHAAGGPVLPLLHPEHQDSLLKSPARWDYQALSGAQITWGLQSWAEDRALWKIKLGWSGEYKMSPEAKQLI